MVLATKKNCQRVLAAGLRVVSAMTGNPPLGTCTETLARSMDVVFSGAGSHKRPLFYLLTNWLAYLYGQIQIPRPNVMPDRRAAGFGFARVDTQAS